MKICLYPHPTSYNRGCEAIAVSTAMILNRTVHMNRMTILSVCPENYPDEENQLIQNTCNIIYGFSGPSIKRFSAIWYQLQLSKLYLIDLELNSTLEKMCKDSMQGIAEENDLFMSIGGDNYCYGKPVWFYSINKYLKSVGKTTVLWGCSIEPANIDDEMIEDLNRYDLITTREQITTAALNSVGLHNTVWYPDPAFVLPTNPPPDLAGFIPGNTIGINLSPLIIGYEKRRNITYKNFIWLIQHILQTTNLQIALIPHVSISSADDRDILHKIFLQFKKTGRVVEIGDHDCMVQKGIIAKCRMFIGSRTHAIIAAYSSCIPTLAVGYSVKAKGIAKDIFGTSDHYVIPVQTLHRETDLIQAFEWMSGNEQVIREHLEKVIPSYIEKAWLAGAEIQRLTDIYAI